VETHLSKSIFIRFFKRIRLPTFCMADYFFPPFLSLLHRSFLLSFFIIFIPSDDRIGAREDSSLQVDTVLYGLNICIYVCKEPFLFAGDFFLSFFLFLSMDCLYSSFLVGRRGEKDVAVSSKPDYASSRLLANYCTTAVQ